MRDDLSTERHLRPDALLRSGAIRNSTSQRPKLIDRVLGLPELDQLCESAVQRTNLFFDAVLDDLNLSYCCSDRDLRRIPAQGACVVVANHPHGLADGLLLGAMLARVRSDVKILANSLLAAIAPIRDRVIAVDPSGDRSQVRANSLGLRQALNWLQRGSLLVVFPAGEVASLRIPEREIADPQWHDTVVRLIRMTGAATVPVFLEGANSNTFQLAGLVHPALRTLLLPRELLNKRDRTIRIAVGHPIRAAALAVRRDDRDIVDYLQWRTQLLASRREEGLRPKAHAGGAPLTDPVETRPCRAEIEALPASQLLLEQGEHAVFLARAAQIPLTLQEIGRLREVSFRQAGEGTGQAMDLDRFDAHYQHLFVWDRERERIVGGYRLAGTDEVLASHGAHGLYTNTLFHFKGNVLAALSPALELGRSFVRPECQRSFAPLLLLWKGIGRYVALNPRYRRLFGPVSISSEYADASRRLMISFLKNRHADSAWSNSIKPRRPHPQPPFWAQDPRLQRPRAVTIDELSEAIADIEPDGKGVPVLVRQYLSVGGRILDFHVDRSFSNSLDGLIVVDLLATEPRLLERYLGRDGASVFRAWHRVAVSA
jgi:putative hemolysin